MRRPISLLLLLAGLLAALPAAAHGPTFEVAYSGVRPQQLVIRVGDTVHFRNRNLAAGACTLVTEDGEWIPSLPRGGDHHETFEAPGTFEFHVKEAPRARGTLIVVEE